MGSIPSPVKVVMTERDQETMLTYYREKCSSLGAENERLRKRVAFLERELMSQGRAS